MPNKSWVDDVFKIRVQCLECNDIITSKSDSEWTECTCGKTSVKGKKFAMIRGKNYKDLSQINYDAIPEHKGWDSKKLKDDI